MGEPEVRGEDVVDAVLRRAKVTATHLRGARGDAAVVRARWVAVVLMWELCPQLSKAGIGRLINRERSTVYHALRRAASHAHKCEFKHLYEQVRRDVLGEDA